MQVLHTTTNYWLVAVSLLTSIIACYTAFSFAERMASSKGRAYYGWLISGAWAMGLGIWSMHYLGMLSVHLPIEVVYHVPTVLASLLLAIFAAGVALIAVSRDQFGILQRTRGSVLMGVGIGGMHYLGMHAMRCGALHRYRPAIVVLSVFVAVGFSWIALWIAFAVRANKEAREWLRLGAAVLMGLGIGAMHYTAMAAVTFEGSAIGYSMLNTVRISTIGVVGIALIIGIVLLGCLFTTLIDRRVYEKLRLLNDQLAEERDRFHAAAECSLDGLYICSAIRDKNGDIEDFAFNYLNSNAEKMAALPLSRMLDGRMCELQPSNRTLGLLERYKQVVLTGVPMVCELAVQNNKANGVWVRIQAVKVRDGVAITASDITSRKLNEERILHLAHHDPLTGLLNRGSLDDRIEQALKYARRNGNLAGVLLIDLDKFKYINDTFGHAAGDCVLITVAARLTNALRAMDSIVRIGGDEFVVVMPELRQFEDAEVAAGKLLETLRLPIHFEELSVTITASIGGAVCPHTGLEIEELLSRADFAMYTAKALGKNRVSVFVEQEGFSNLPLPVAAKHR